MKTRPHHITEHAVLRYIERVLGVDVDGARAEIARVVAVAEAHDGATGVLKDGFRYVLAGETVVTVRPVHGPSVRTARCDRRQVRDEE